MRLEKLDTREKIILTATRLFAENDYQSVSVKAVAAAAGVHVALISYYFNGKLNLYVEIMKRQAQILRTAAKEIDQLPLAPLDKLRCLCARLVEIKFSEGTGLNVLFKAVLDPRPESEAVLIGEVFRIEDEIIRYLQLAQEAGVVRCEVRTQSAAFAILSTLAIYCMAYRQIQHNRRQTDDELKRSMQVDCEALLASWLVSPQETEEA